MDKSFWRETVRKNANEKNMGSCNKSKGRVYTEEEKSLSAVKRREGEGKRVHQKAVVERYILPSKSPQIAPVFFVGKKDRKKWMVQDYQYLNEWIYHK